MTTEISLEAIESARNRLAPRIRRTPQMIFTLDSGQEVSAKLENLQVSGSFKIRGALNTVLGLSKEKLERGLVTASGGNHGMGVATAGAMTGTKTTIYLPENTPQSKVDKLRKIATEVIVSGSVWDDANALALTAAKEGKHYVHPFADTSVIAGQGTIGLEILEDAPDLDIGVEAIGAPTLKTSLDAGELTTLDKIETKASTLAPRRSEEVNFRIISRLVDDILLVSDEDMKRAAEWLWQNVGLGVELSAAAAVAALQSGRFSPDPSAKTGVIICGAGPDGFDISGK